MASIPKDELNRKIFHMLILVYAFGYMFLSKWLTVWVVGAIIVVVAAMETVRLTNTKRNAYFLKLFGEFHRREEKRKISGLIWTLSGAFLAMLIFPDEKIVFASFLYLAFGDAFAAIVGRSIGRHKILGGKKSLEGSAACFIVCFITGLFLFNWQFALIAAVIVTLVEAVPWPLNDNFWMQIVNAGLLSVLAQII